MRIYSTRLATARRTTLSLSLFAALVMAGSTQQADAEGRAHNTHQSGEYRRPGAFAAFETDRTPSAAPQTDILPGHVIPVSSCADDNSAGTLRKAMEGAASGDTLDMSGLSCTSISLVHGALESAVTNLSLVGPGVDALTIDGNNADRVLRGVNITVSDLTIAHGVLLSNQGGGCVLTNGNLSLTRTKISGCLSLSGTSSSAGGGVAVFGHLSMHDSAILSSTASGLTLAAGGGALAISASLYDSEISGNSAKADQENAFGGGLATSSGEVLLHASTIGGNTATSTHGRAYGGGIHAQGNFDVSILEGSIVSGNTASSGAAQSYGGGINSGVISNAYVATVEIDHSSVTDNTASSDCASCSVRGGGVHAFDSVTAIYSAVAYNDATCTTTNSTCRATGGGLASTGVESGSKVSLLNATVSSNKAQGGSQFGGLGIGGGIWIGSDKPLMADNSTIAFNHASDLAGGVGASSPANAPSVVNSTILSNSGTDTGSNDVGPALIGATFAVGGANNLVMSADATITLPAGTLSADPHLLALTTDDGGVTSLHPLAPNSIAVNAGSNAPALGCDQRGYPYRRVNGAAADIGAYETQGERHLFADGFELDNSCL